jgi:hypothetical protein
VMVKSNTQVLESKKKINFSRMWSNTSEDVRLNAALRVPPLHVLNPISVLYEPNKRTGAVDTACEIGASSWLATLTTVGR